MRTSYGDGALRRGPLLFWIAALAAVYFVAGRLGLSLAFLHASATAVWPPTGIAIAALLILGPAVWPGVALGALLVNLAVSGSLIASLGIAIGNTLEAVVAARLVTRYARGARAFERAADVVRFAVLAGLVAPSVSATIGLASLTLAGLTTPAQWAAVWLTWWLGDAGGAVVVAPALILAATSRDAGAASRPFERILMLAALSGVAVVLFGGVTPISAANYPLGFLVIPVLLWPAFRAGPRLTSYSVLVLVAFAVWGTLGGDGPFGREDRNEALLLVQTFAGVTALTALFTAALVQERRRLGEELERRVAERTEELRVSESRLLEAQAIAHVGSWDWDVASNRIWWSEELHRIYGLEPGDTPDGYEAFLELVHPDDRQALSDAVGACLTAGVPFELEHRLVRHDGVQRLVVGRGRAVRDPAGAVARLTGTSQDVTERKRADEEHRKLLDEQAARRQAEEASRLKDRFLAMVSHELRTPINVVLGWARMLTTNTLDPTAAARAVEVIERNAQAQARLIDDLLDVSRFAAGQPRIVREWTDLGAVVGTAVEELTPAASARGIHIAVHSDGGPHRVLGDPQRLEQIVFNLLSNAVKFTPDGGRIRIELARADVHVELCVRDSGMGISTVHLGQVFEPFWQADTTQARAHGGLGLGLAIVRNLVEAHGGTITADSPGEGLGASFVVRFPHEVEERRQGGAEGPQGSGA